MLPKRLFLGVLLLTTLIMITGCVTTGRSEDDYETRYRNASDECIRFGHVTGSDDYYGCIDRRLDLEKRFQVLAKIQGRHPLRSTPHPATTELSASGANETDQISAIGESRIDESGLKRLPKLAVTAQEPAFGIDGTWTGVAIDQSGGAHKLTFTFKADGNTLRGTVKGRLPPKTTPLADRNDQRGTTKGVLFRRGRLTTTPLENGRITDNNFSFTYSGDPYGVGVPLTFVFTGLFLGDELKLSWIYEGGGYGRYNAYIPPYSGTPQTFIAKRVK